MAILFLENGPGVGQTYPLDAAKTIVGRHPNCDIVVDAGAVSRHHAQFLVIDGDFFVEDLNSRNGTFVNGELLDGRHQLELGDRIQVCDVTFRLDEPQGGSLMGVGSSHTGVMFDEAPNESSRIMSRLDFVASKSGSVEIAASADVKLHALIEITRSLSRTLAIDEVMPKLLDELFKIFVQADRGFLILRGPEGELIPRHTKLRRGDDDTMIRLSKTIINEVVETKQAILSSDTMDDQRFQLSDSIASFRIRSFICAPLPDAEGNVLGVIQLDSLDPRHRFKDDDLDLLASVASQAGLAIDNAQLHDAVVRQRVLERDLELASEVQRGFLPQELPKLDHYELSRYYQPADKVGGDYFDFIPLPNDRWAVIVADVVGHGMAAALQTAQLSTALKFSLSAQPDPAMAIRELNAKISQNSLEDRFITLCMVVLDANTSKVRIVNAGHNPPLLCRPTSSPYEVGAETRGVPLLVMDTFPYESVAVDLAPGDILLLYTDGLTESMNPHDELYGIRRVMEQSRGVTSGAELTKRLISDARNFSESVPQLDDICLVSCRHR